MKPGIIAACAALFAAAIATAAPVAAGPPGPDIARCPLLPPLEDQDSARRKPLPTRGAMAGLLRSNRDQFAVRTFTGATHCVDTRWMLKAGQFALSRDGRFLSFDWAGYEAGGHVVIDRTGPGSDIDTGNTPTFSPSGRRIGAKQWSEASFGALEGFAVWQVDPVGLRRIAFIQELPQMSEWRLDRWQGESCIELSAIPFDRLPDDQRQLAKVRRERLHARESPRGWRIAQGRCAS